VKLVEAHELVKLDEAENPVKLEEAMVSRVGGFSVNLTVLLTVGRGWLDCDPLLVKDHVRVTNVCA